MTILCGRECRIIVSENLLYRIDGFAVLQQHGCHGMPQVVKTNLADPAVFQRFLKLSRKSSRMQRQTFAVTKN